MFKFKTKTIFSFPKFKRCKKFVSFFFFFFARSTFGCAVGVVVKGSERNIHYPFSNSDQAYYIQFWKNTLGKVL